MSILQLPELFKNEKKSHPKDNFNCLTIFDTFLRYTLLLIATPTRCYLIPSHTNSHKTSQCTRNMYLLLAGFV